MFRVMWILPLCLLLPGQEVLPSVSTDDSDPEEAIATSQDVSASPLEEIIKNQPLRFLEMCLEKYDREVKGYTCTFLKHERMHKKLQEREKIKVAFREGPYSVFFEWLQGAGRAKKVLYIAGENKGMMRVRPNGFVLGAFVVSRDPDGDEAKHSSRYTIKQFGPRLATQRTLDAMKRAQARGALHVRYEGLVQVPELNDRPCYKFVRTPYDPPEEDGVNEFTFYIDKDTWLQVGSILRDVKGELIAEYLFRDIHLNPEFPPDQFTPGKL